MAKNRCNNNNNNKKKKKNQGPHKNCQNVLRDDFGNLLNPNHQPRGFPNMHDNRNEYNVNPNNYNNPANYDPFHKPRNGPALYEPKKPFLSSWGAFNSIHNNHDKDHMDDDGDTYMCDCSFRSVTMCHTRAIHDIHMTLENCRVMEEFIVTLTNDPLLGDIARSQWDNYKPRLIQKGFAS